MPFAKVWEVIFYWTLTKYNSFLSNFFPLSFCSLLTKNKTKTETETKKKTMTNDTHHLSKIINSIEKSIKTYKWYVSIESILIRINIQKWLLFHHFSPYWFSSYCWIVSKAASVFEPRASGDLSFYGKYFYF